MRSSAAPRSVALLVAVATLSLLPAGPGSSLRGQSVTTSAVRGTVRATDGTYVDRARVTIVHAATGFRLAGEVRDGRFLVQGLQVGGPYSVAIERPGFVPALREGLFLSLGSALELDLVIEPSPFAQDTLRVAVARPFLRASPSAGTATTVSDSVLRRLPTLDRDLYDFLRLVPQVSTRVGLALGGISGGGVGVRFNEFLIDGASERTVSGGLPTSRGGAKSMPLEAVKEYQVLLAPYDVRYGDFAGALVNTVTRAGTNELAGAAFAYWRNDHLARQGDADSLPPYQRWQYGFWLGGPIVRDRLHFFVAPELQHLTSAAPGPYVGQPSGSDIPLPIREADLARLDEIMREYGLVAGSGGPVENSQPLRNLFGRLDLALPEWRSRAVLSQGHARDRSSDLSRDEETFPLSTYQATAAADTWTGSLQLHTALDRARGGHNELLLSRWSARLEGRSAVRQPIVRVAVPGATGGGVTLETGTHETAQGSFFDGWTLGLADNLTLPLGPSHVVTVGIELERFHLERRNALGSFGTWTFSSLDSLQGGIPERYELRRDFGSASVPIGGGQYAVYAGDRWRASERLAVTAGVRADLLDIGARAPYNPVVDSIFGRRTDERFRPRVHLSPRLGFEWDPSGTGRDRFRGGAGIFVGRPPVAWIHSAISSYGLGIGVLRCGPSPADLGDPPAFEPDVGAAPTACAGGADLAASPRGDVDLLDDGLRMARTLRASLAYDREELPGDLLATAEVLVTRNLSDFVFVNLNLEGPQGTDRYGRVLYGTAVGPNGVITPKLRSDFAEVIDLRNTSRNRSYQLVGRLEKRFARGTAAASYTYSRVRDVQTPVRVNVSGTVNWSSRAVSGRHDDLTLAASGNDVPHRVVLAGTLAAPWARWPTVFSFYYVGESGAPFTYRAGGVGRRGDLNGDGSSLNDPIYVPVDAFDSDEIAFSGFSEAAGDDNSQEAQAERVSRQRAAFERLIENSACLRRQRGRILERNSCREPWSHTTILSVRQTVPVRGASVDVELQLFNLLNLLDRGGGLFRVAAPALLEHVGQTAGGPEVGQPAFRFDPARPEWRVLPTESAFQLQLALRYRF